MKNATQRLLAAAALGAVALALTAMGGTTNAAPWSDSFEPYPAGTQIAGTNGWTADMTMGGVISTNPAVTVLLTNNVVFPLPAATHSNVLEVDSQVINDTGSRTGVVVATAFMTLPTWLDGSPPTGDTNAQYSLCVSTNGWLTIWHFNASLAANQWLELTNGPMIGTNAWARFTVLHDYLNHLFQVQVNEAAPIVDNAGWTAGGLSPTGSWFRMVQTNAMLSRLTIGAASAYIDDMLVTNRTLSWSGTGFTESTANNGTLAPPAITVTLAFDTFAGSSNENFVTAGRATVTNVPPGLTAVVTRASATQVSIVLTNAALLHERANTISNLMVRFEDAAFTHGNAWDVTGRQQTNLTVAFLDTPRLTFSTNVFGETAANDGSIFNAPLQISLTNGTFSSNGNANFGTNLSLNLPAGLTGDVVVVTNTLIQVRLLGRATTHNVADNANVTFVFLDGAFDLVSASSVFNNNTNVLISYTDPSILTYGMTAFTEKAANDGSVNGTTLTLTNKAFNAATNEDLMASGKAGAANLPAGLGLQILCSNATQATLVFTNRATAHAASNSIANLGITFADNAFVGGNAAGVSNAVRNDLALQFSDQPVLTASYRTFTEAGLNDGSIGNMLSVTLAGDSFAVTTFTQGVHYAVANVPPGLTFSLARISGSMATASLGGNALSHAASNSIANMRVTFLDAAFTTVGAANIAGHPIDFAVSFADQPVLTYGVDTFRELSAGYIDNRSPPVITVAGDTFNGINGQDFVQAGWLTVQNLPAGLTAQATRDSDNGLSVKLLGAAPANSAADTVLNVTFVFQPGALAHALISQALNTQKTGVRILFANDIGFVNVMPYEEPFEVYANGLWLAGTNGWAAETFADAAIVTNDAVANSNVLAYLTAGHSQLPVATPHTQVLYVRDTIQDAISSETAPRVYVDFMAVPVALQAPAETDTNLQYAFYVSTNSQLVAWHQNRTASPVNEWITLTNAGTISTSAWSRFTVTLDYTHNMYQLQVNERRPITDAHGWTEGGASRTGSWYYMVQTNGVLSGLRVTGVGPGYLDDLTVKTSLPELFGCRAGTVFKVR